MSLDKHTHADNSQPYQDMEHGIFLTPQKVSSNSFLVKHYTNSRQSLSLINFTTQIFSNLANTNLLRWLLGLFVMLPSIFEHCLLSRTLIFWLYLGVFAILRFILMQLNNHCFFLIVAGSPIIVTKPFPTGSTCMVPSFTLNFLCIWSSFYWIYRKKPHLSFSQRYFGCPNAICQKFQLFLSDLRCRLCYTLSFHVYFGCSALSIPDHWS